MHLWAVAPSDCNKMWIGESRGGDLPNNLNPKRCEKKEINLCSNYFALLVVKLSHVICSDPTSHDFFYLFFFCFFFGCVFSVWVLSHPTMPLIFAKNYFPIQQCPYSCRTFELLIWDMSKITFPSNTRLTIYSPRCYASLKAKRWEGFCVRISSENPNISFFFFLKIQENKFLSISLSLYLSLCHK